MRLIDADAFKKNLEKEFETATDAYDAVDFALEDTPTIEAEPVKHGKWVVENEESIRCSECCFNRANIKMPLDYCPNCGAKMGLEADT